MQNVFRKTLSLILVLVLCLGGFVPEARAAQKEDWKDNIFQISRLTESSLDIDKAHTILFVDSQTGAPKNSVDISQAGDRSVLAWRSGSTVYVGAEGGVNGDMACEEGLGKLPFRYVDFGGCFHLDKVTDLSFQFYLSGVSFVDFSDLDLSMVTDMSYLFNNSGLVMADFTNVDTSSLVNMNSMFAKCQNLTELYVDDLDTGKVTDMGAMFYESTGIRSLNLSAWDTSSVTSLDSMFRGCRDLVSLNLSGWDTSKVEIMAQMFVMFDEEGPMNTEYWDLGEWETDSVTVYHEFLPEGTLYKGAPWEELFAGVQDVTSPKETKPAEKEETVTPEKRMEEQTYLKAYGKQLAAEGFSNRYFRDNRFTGEVQIVYKFPDPTGEICVIFWPQEKDPMVMVTFENPTPDKNDAQKSRQRVLCAAAAIDPELTPEVIRDRFAENPITQSDTYRSAQWKENGFQYTWMEYLSNGTYTMTITYLGDK